ncbi:MAG: NAD(P)-dependent oxidoreductase, partial [Eubacterium sp.]
TAYLINVGRGSLIDQDALVDALNHREIAGAALDVMTPEPLPENNPLWDAENCILTPHISGNMTLGYTAYRCIELFCDNFRRYAAGEPMHNIVDRKRGY